MIPTPRTDAPNGPHTSPRRRARATSHVSSRRVLVRVVVLVRVASSEIARDARHARARAVPSRSGRSSAPRSPTIAAFGGKRRKKKKNASAKPTKDDRARPSSSSLPRNKTSNNKKNKARRAERRRRRGEETRGGTTSDDGKGKVTKRGNNVPKVRVHGISRITFDDDDVRCLPASSGSSRRPAAFLSFSLSLSG